MRTRLRWLCRCVAFTAGFQPVQRHAAFVGDFDKPFVRQVSAFLGAGNSALGNAQSRGKGRVGVHARRPLQAGQLRFHISGAVRNGRRRGDVRRSGNPQTVRRRACAGNEPFGGRAGNSGNRLDKTDVRDSFAALVPVQRLAIYTEPVGKSFTADASTEFLETISKAFHMGKSSAAKVFRKLLPIRKAILLVFIGKTDWKQKITFTALCIDICFRMVQKEFAS